MKGMTSLLLASLVRHGTTAMILQSSGTVRITSSFTTTTTRRQSLRWGGNHHHGKQRATSSSSRSMGRQDNTDSWDDFDPFDTRTTTTSSNPPTRRGGQDRFRSSTAPRRRQSRDTNPRNNNSKNNSSSRYYPDNDNNRRRIPQDHTNRINMKALEATFDHLYGIAPVLNALKADRRDWTADGPSALQQQQQRQLIQENSADDVDTVKPEAQFVPALFVQDRSSSSTTTRRTSSKNEQAEQIERLARQRQIPIHYVDKGVLNTLASNRPHQGYVLRCGKLQFQRISKMVDAQESLSSSSEAISLWLALDQVVDPQNLGALLRSAYVLSGGSMGVLVTAKNSAPPTPVVSAASAGALELMDIYATNNLARFLDQTEGYRIVAASVTGSSENEDEEEDNLMELPTFPREGKTIVVLGSEGHGIRPLVARSCTHFVKIPGSVEGVDSLNVSVSGAILLYHFLHGQ